MAIPNQVATLQARIDSELEDLVVEPEVRLLAATQVVDIDFGYYISDPETPSFTGKADGAMHEDGEYLIEFAGRECYQSFHNPAGRTTDEYIQNIIKQKHYSVLEHVNATFRLEGVSRSFTHELIRHRHHSYSQLSQRYVDTEDIRFVCPPLFRNDPQLKLIWFESIRPIAAQANKLLWWAEQRNPDKPRKVIREAIRSILPNATETKIVVTGNLRAWRELLEKRWNVHADAEICEVSGLIAAELKALYPSVFNDINYAN